MIDFSEKFLESGGSPIEYGGKILVTWDRFSLPGPRVRLRYRIVSTDSEWRQGFDMRTEGTIAFDNGDRVRNHWMGIWEDESPLEDEFTCCSKNGLLDVRNIWDTGNGTVESWINGAAMWIEEIPNGRRYHCNDGHFDDDLNDIIFEIVVMGPAEADK